MFNIITAGFIGYVLCQYIKGTFEDIEDDEDDEREIEPEEETKEEFKEEFKDAIVYYTYSDGSMKKKKRR